MSFTSVTKSHKCPICGKSTWCSYSLSLNYVVCRRERRPDGKVKVDRNGKEYYVYLLNLGARND